MLLRENFEVNYDFYTYTPLRVPSFGRSYSVIINHEKY